MIDLESIPWHPRAIIEKWTEEQVANVRALTGIDDPDGDTLSHYTDPVETMHVDGNALTLAGGNRITSLIIGAGGQALTNTATRLGVADNVAAVLPGDTDLGSGSKYFNIMDATYPQQSNMAMTFKATFGTSVGNFAWNTWGIDVGTPTVTSSATVNALLVNRKAHAMGTKVSGSWALTVIVTLM
jgi:hypothetical protein